MKALTFHGKEDVRVDEVADPSIQDPTDAIVRITSTAICGSDLHLYAVLGMFIDEGDILGHEPMGVVEEVGPEVQQIAPGDRVVIPFNISCGHCWMCERQFYAQCETTQNREQEKGASLFGYTKMYGQVPGGQAELLRVPQAQFGPIKVPDDGSPDERYLFLSDVLPTAWQAVDYAAIPEGGSVAVFGLGPIGQMSARIARHRGAGEVFGVDNVPERLAMAERHGVTPVNHDEIGADVSDHLREQTDGRGDAEDDRHVARRDRGEADRKGGGRPARGAPRLHRLGPPRRHRLYLRRLRRPARPAADDADLRQGPAAADGPGPRAPVDRRDPAAARRRCRRPARGRGPDHPPLAAAESARGLLDVPAQGRRRDQGGAGAIAPAAPDSGIKVVVTGASGNVGTSVLAALAAAPGVAEIVGLARRLPEVERPKVRWAQADVTTTGLAPLFAGADAVIHLAWAIQPSRDEATMERVNVGGSDRVFAAVAAAGVPVLIHASSVGAYSEGPKDQAVDESWPTGGIETSAYSRHKAAVETMLDRFEGEHPQVRVVRLRPGLIFKAEAASEIRRFFLGPLFPNPLLRPGLLPFAPAIERFCFQAVHSDDVGEAYRQALVREVSGAFNIAAEPVIGAAELAEILGARGLRLPPGLLRAAADVTWRLRLQPADPGWIDLALGAPAMSVERAKAELGFAPRHDAGEALAELLNALRRGEGGATPPLRADAGGPLRGRELASGIGARNRA